MREQNYAVNGNAQAEQLEVSRVLRNTYGLLALTLAFSGVMAFVAQQMRVGYPNVFVVLIGFYGLFFLTNKLRDSAWGLVSAFALTFQIGQGFFMPCYLSNTPQPTWVIKKTPTKAGAVSLRVEVSIRETLPESG